MEESVYTAPTSVKVIRNKQTGLSGRCFFIEFNTRVTAESVLQTYNGTINWGPFTVRERLSRQDVGPVHTFRVRYKPIKGAKFVIDKTTVRSKGYVCVICR